MSVNEIMAEVKKRAAARLGESRLVEEGCIDLRWEECHRDEAHDAFRVNTYGFLSGIEVNFTEPLPNMDVADPYLIEFKVTTHRGEYVYGYRVIAHYESVPGLVTK